MHKRLQHIHHSKTIAKDHPPPPRLHSPRAQTPSPNQPQPEFDLFTALGDKSKTGDTNSHMGLPTNTTSCVELSATPSSRTASLIALAHSRIAGAELASRSSGWHLYNQGRRRWDTDGGQGVGGTRRGERCGVCYIYD